MKIRKSLLYFLAIAISFSVGCSGGSEQVRKEEFLVLEGATLIDGTGALPRENTTIVIFRDQILRIGDAGSVSHPGNATVIDMNGRYVLPGFIDTHVHLASDPEVQKQTMRTLLAFGVTTIRNPGAMPGAGIELRDKVASGEILGPRMLTAGRFIYSPPAGREVASVKTENEIIQEVRRQASSGVDFIKLQFNLPLELVVAAISEAHKHGIKVVGHLGKTRWIDAAHAGIDGLFHSDGSGPIWDLIPQRKRNEFFNTEFKSPSERFQRWREIVRLNGPEMDDLVSALLKNNIEVNPTLVRTEAVWWGDDLSILKQLEPRYAPEANLWWGENWRQRHPYAQKLSSEDLADRKAIFPTILEIFRVLYERGVLITAGTDVGNAWITPGVSFHRELELLAAAGIKNLDVLRIATRNGAEALDILEEVGTIEGGKLADIVVLKANPLDNIVNTREIEIVIKAGRRFAPETLLRSYNTLSSLTRRSRQTPNPE